MIIKITNILEMLLITNNLLYCNYFENIKKYLPYGTYKKKKLLLSLSNLIQRS